MNLKFWKKKPKIAEDEGSSQEDDDKTVAMEKPDLDLPTAAKAGFLSRISAIFSGITRRFRKTPASEGEDAGSPEADDKTVAMDVPDQDQAPAVKTSLLTRITSPFAKLVSRFRKKPVPEEEGEEERTSRSHEKQSEESDDDAVIRSIRRKKRLIIGSAAGLLVLVLAGIGFAVWKFLLSPPKEEAHEPATAAQGAIASKHPEKPMTELEELRKKNEELQAQIRSLKKEQPQEPLSDSGSEGQKADASSQAKEGELTLSNKDPKAAAQSLKEAIEAMNAASGSPPRKAAQ